MIAEDFKNTGYILHPAKGKIPFFANFATIQDLETAISKLNSLTPKVVDELPAVGEVGVLYFVSVVGSGTDQSKEYIWVEEENRFELIGSTGVDLNDYVTKSGVDEITGSKTFTEEQKFKTNIEVKELTFENRTLTGASSSWNVVQNFVADNSNMHIQQHSSTGSLLVGSSGFGAAFSFNPQGSFLFEKGVTFNQNITIANVGYFNGGIEVSTGKIGVGDTGWILGSTVSNPVQSDDGKHRLRCIIGNTMGYFLTHEIVKNNTWVKSPIIVACQWDFLYHSEGSILVKTPTTDFQAANKKYVDDKFFIYYKTFQLLGRSSDTSPYPVIIPSEAPSGIYEILLVDMNIVNSGFTDVYIEIPMTQEDYDLTYNFYQVNPSLVKYPGQEYFVPIYQYYDTNAKNISMSFTNSEASLKPIEDVRLKIYVIHTTGVNTTACSIKENSSDETNMLNFNVSIRQITS